MDLLVTRCSLLALLAFSIFFFGVHDTEALPSDRTLQAELAHVTRQLENPEGNKPDMISSIRALVNEKSELEEALASVYVGTQSQNSLDAIKAFEKAVTLRPSNLEANLRFALEIVKALRSGRLDTTSMKGGDYVNAAVRGFSKATELIKLDSVESSSYAHLLELRGEKGDLARAVELLKDAVSRDPDNVNLRLQLGNALRAQKNLHGAKREFEEALKLAPGDPTLRIHLAAANADIGDIQASKKTLLSLLETNPSNVNALVELGRLETRPDVAEEYLTRAVQLDSSRADAWERLGEIGLKKKDFALAKHSFEQCLSVERKPSVLLGYAEALSADGRKKQAIQILEDLLNSDSSVSGDVQFSIISLLAASYAAADEVEKAKDMYTKVLSRSDVTPDRLHKISGDLHRLGLMKQAAINLREAAEASPNSFNAHAGLGAILFAQGNLKGALESYEAAVKIKSDYLTYNTIGRIHADNEKYQEAADAFNKAAQLEPADKESRKALGDIFIRVGQHSDALAIFLELEKIDPSDPSAFLGAGDCLTALKRHEEAAVEYERAAALSPSYENLLKFADALLSLKQFSSAQTVYERALSTGGTYQHSLSTLNNALIAATSHEKPQSDKLLEIGHSLELALKNDISHSRERFSAMYNLAQAYSLNGAVQKAVALFGDILAVGGPDMTGLSAQEMSDIAFWMGDLLEKSGHRKEALSAFEQSMRLSMSSDSTIQALTSAFRAAEIHFALHNFSLAKEQYRLALRSRDSGVKLQSLFRLASLEEDEETAIQYLTDARSLASNNFDVTLLLAKKYRAIGKRQEAESLLKQASQLSPNRAEPATMLGDMYRESEDFKTAADMYKISLAIDNDPKVIIDLADCYKRLGMKEAALELYQRLSKTSKVSAESRYYEAVLLNELGKEQDAVNNFISAIQIDPAFEPAYKTLVEILSKHGFNSDALSYARGLVDTQSASGAPTPSAYLLLAQTLSMDSNYAEAAKFFRKVLETDPTSGEAHSGLVTALESNGLFKDARSHWENTLVVLPSIENGYLRLAQLMQMEASQEKIEAYLRDAEDKEKGGDWAAARDSYQMALTLTGDKPQRAPILHKLGVIGLKQSDMSYALENLYHSIRAWNMPGTKDFDVSKVDTQVAIAEAFWMKGRVDLAMTELDDVLAVYPRHSAALLLKARTMLSDPTHDLNATLAFINDILEIDPNNMDVQVLAAEAELQSGASAVALERFEKILESDPTQSSAVEKLIPLYLKEGYPDRAFEMLMRKAEASSIDNEKYRTMVQAATIACKNAATTSKGLEVLHTVHDEFEQVLTPQAWAFLGEDWHTQGKHPEALAAFENGLAISPNDPNLHYWVGTEHYNLGDNDKALYHLERAQLQTPNAVSNLNNLAAVYLAVGRVRDSIVTLKKALSVDPDNLNANMNLATVFKDQGKHEAAASYYHKVLEADPTSRTMLRNYLQTAFHLKRFGQAQELGLRLKKLASNDDETFEANNLLQDLYWEQKLYKESGKLLKEMIERKEKATASHFERLAGCYFHLKNYEKAFDITEKGIERFPDDAGILHTRGIILYKLDRVDEAKATLEKVQEISPKHRSQHDLELLEFPSPLWREEPLQPETFMLSSIGLGTNPVPQPKPKRQ